MSDLDMTTRLLAFHHHAAGRLLFNVTRVLYLVLALSTFAHHELTNQPLFAVYNDWLNMK